MGVPKFYRYMSERYPCLSQVIKEHQIPEFDGVYKSFETHNRLRFYILAFVTISYIYLKFCLKNPSPDNLYLDMNGIIHPCSHPNDDDPHFRITEEQIFKDIFHYIECLFRIIRPRKVW